MIFLIFNMVAAGILDFRNSQLLLPEGVQRARMHHRAIFHQNTAIWCGDIAIFRLFKMAAVRHLRYVWGIFGPST